MVTTEAEAIKAALAAANQQYNKIQRLLQKLRITEARLERYRQKYIEIGIPKEIFDKFYQAINELIIAINHNLQTLNILAVDHSMLQQLDEPQEINKKFALEKSKFVQKLHNFLADNNIQQIANKISKAEQINEFLACLTADIRQQDKLWAELTQEQHHGITVAEVLLPNIGDDIITHMADYYELFNKLIPLTAYFAGELIIDLAPLRAAVISCEQAHLTSLQSIWKIDIERHMTELTKQLQQPFYDRNKHRSFIKKRDKVVQDLSKYLVEHCDDLPSFKENMAEIAGFIINLLIEEQISINKLDPLLKFFYDGFSKQLFKTLQKPLNFAIGKAAAAAIINNIKEQVAQQLMITADQLTTRVGRNVIMKLAKQNSRDS